MVESALTDTPKIMSSKDDVIYLFQFKQKEKFAGYAMSEFVSLADMFGVNHGDLFKPLDKEKVSYQSSNEESKQKMEEKKVDCDTL